jgi:peptide/nickel transport system substrate-binding protein
MAKRLMAMLGALVVLSMMLSACATPTPETIVETVEVEVEKIVEVEKEVPVEVTAVPEPEPETPAGPKTLVVCQGQEPDTLYPYGGDMLASSHVQHAVYDGVGWGGGDTRTYAYQPTILTKLPDFDDGDAVIEAVTVQEGDMVVDDSGNPVELATGLEEPIMVRPAGCNSSECAVEFDGEPFEMDQMVVTFELREGITWSNGDPLTADDSVYSFELNADPDTPTSRFTVDRTASYEATSDVNTVWTGLPGYIDSVYFANFWQPFPRAYWQDELGYTAADLQEAEESSRTPIGYGAFIVTEWVAGDHITVEKNPNYYRADEGLPYLDTVIFRFVADSNAAVAQLISGECDIATQDTALEDQAELLLKLEQEGVVNPIFVTGTVWEHADFGINPVDDYDRPDFFEDVRVRQAFAMCLDRESVIDTLLYGRSIVIDSYIPPEHPLYADGLTTWPYDPEAGMALLEEVGWVMGDDGVRVASGVEGVPDGTPLAFTWESTNATLRIQYMQIYQQNLAECGFDVNLENLNATEFFADGPDGPLFGRRFDVGSFAWLTGVEPPCDLYLGQQTPDEENGWAGQNNPGFMNDEYDAACLRAVTALPGSDDYVEGHKESQRIFSEQLPVVPLFLRLKLAATRPEVQGFVMDPTENSEMWNIETLDLDM